GIGADLDSDEDEDEDEDVDEVPLKRNGDKNEEEPASNQASSSSSPIPSQQNGFPDDIINEQNPYDLNLDYYDIDQLPQQPQKEPGPENDQFLDFLTNLQHEAGGSSSFDENPEDPKELADLLAFAEKLPESIPEDQSKQVDEGAPQPQNEPLPASSNSSDPQQEENQEPIENHVPTPYSYNPDDLLNLPNDDEDVNQNAFNTDVLKDSPSPSPGIPDTPQPSAEQFPEIEPTSGDPFQEPLSEEEDEYNNLVSQDINPSSPDIQEGFSPSNVNSPFDPFDQNNVSPEPSPQAPNEPDQEEIFPVEGGDISDQQEEEQ